METVKLMVDSGMMATCEQVILETDQVVLVHGLVGNLNEMDEYHFHHSVGFNKVGDPSLDVRIICPPSVTCYHFKNWEDVEKLKRDLGLEGSSWDIHQDDEG